MQHGLNNITQGTMNEGVKVKNEGKPLQYDWHEGMISGMIFACLFNPFICTRSRVETCRDVCLQYCPVTMSNNYFCFHFKQNYQFFFFKLIPPISIINASKECFLYIYWNAQIPLLNSMTDLCWIMNSI